MEQAGDQKERPRAYSNYGFSASGMASSSAASVTQSTGFLPKGSPQQQQVEPRLRSMPGYTPGSPDFLSSRLGGPQQKPQQQPVLQPSSPLGVGTSRPASQGPNVFSMPYQSRERVYYQSPLMTPSSGPLNGKSDTANGSTQASARPLSENELKAEAPPSGSLYDDPLSPERRPLETFHSQSKEIEGISSRIASSPNRVFTSSSLVDVPTFSSGSTDPLDCWVTVFGFSGAQAQAVLAHFQTLGQVVKTELGQRNWIHIQYDSPWAAQKALLKNGSVLASAGSCMIGVLPTKKAVDQVGMASTSFMSPLKKGAEAAAFVSPFAPSASIPPQSSLRTATDASAVPQTPGFPQGTLYTSIHSQPFPPRVSGAAAPVKPVSTSIFAGQAAKEQAGTAEASVDSEGFVTRTFNYIFGF